MLGAERRWVNPGPKPTSPHDGLAEQSDDSKPVESLVVESLSDGQDVQSCRVVETLMCEVGGEWVGRGRPDKTPFKGRQDVLNHDGTTTVETKRSNERKKKPAEDVRRDRSCSESV